MGPVTNNDCQDHGSFFSVAMSGIFPKGKTVPALLLAYCGFLKGLGYRPYQISNTFFLAAAYSSSVSTPDLCSSANFFNCSVGSFEVAVTAAAWAGAA